MSCNARWAIVSWLAIFACVAAVRADILVGSWQSRDVRRFADDGTPLGVFIPVGAGGLTTPDGLAYGADGHLYVSSAEQRAVLRFDGQTGAFMNVFATTGITRAGFCAFGPDGLLYVCSSGNNRVLRFDPSSGALVDEFITDPLLDFPAGLAWVNGRLLVSNFGGGGVISYDAATGARIGVFSAATQPLYMRVAGPDEIQIADFGTNRLRRVRLSTGASLGSITSPSLNGPVGLLTLPDGSYLVTSWNNGSVLRFSSTNTFLSVLISGYPQANDIIAMPIPGPGAVPLMLLGLFGVACRRRPRA